MTTIAEDVAKIKSILDGKILLGFMRLKKKEYKVGDWDNAIALYTGDILSPKVYVLRTENQDYSCYDKWILDEAEYIARDDRYKTIGEEMEIIDKRAEIKDWNAEEKENYWLIIKTKSKILEFGHKWFECCYPASLWREGAEK